MEATKRNYVLTQDDGRKLFMEMFDKYMDKLRPREKRPNAPKAKKEEGSGVGDPAPSVVKEEPGSGVGDPAPTTAYTRDVG